MNRLITSKVQQEYDGTRLDLYLAKRFTYLSRTEWQKEIKNSTISINGIVVINHHKKIKVDDVIDYSGNTGQEPEVDTGYTIIYQDEHIIGINKPGRLPVHPAGAFFNNTLVCLMQNDMGIPLYPIHRLDRETSGVILFAKDKGMIPGFHSGYANAEKIYIAIVHGNIVDQKFTINMPIGTDQNSVVRKKRAAYPEAEEQAMTHFEKIISFVSAEDHNEYSIVRARLETGRQHQIRVHLLYAGHPILGDKLYGLDETFYLEFIENGYTDSLLKKTGFPRSALHASSLTFNHQKLGKELHIKAPFPKDMQDFLEKGGVDLDNRDLVYYK